MAVKRSETELTVSGNQLNSLNIVTQIYSHHPNIIKDFIFNGVT